VNVIHSSRRVKVADSLEQRGSQRRHKVRTGPAADAGEVGRSWLARFRDNATADESAIREG